MALLLGVCLSFFYNTAVVTCHSACLCLKIHSWNESWSYNGRQMMIPYYLYWGICAAFFASSIQSKRRHGKLRTTILCSWNVAHLCLFEFLLETSNHAWSPKLYDVRAYTDSHRGSMLAKAVQSWQVGRVTKSDGDMTTMPFSVVLLFSDTAKGVLLLVIVMLASSFGKSNGAAEQQIVQHSHLRAGSVVLSSEQSATKSVHSPSSAASAYCGKAHKWSTFPRR